MEKQLLQRAYPKIKKKKQNYMKVYTVTLLTTMSSKEEQSFRKVLISEAKLLMDSLLFYVMDGGMIKYFVSLWKELEIWTCWYNFLQTSRHQIQMTSMVKPFSWWSWCRKWRTGSSLQSKTAWRSCSWNDKWTHSYMNSLSAF